MSTRSAEATIKGYYYQFDTSILALLKLKNDSDTVVIEGIEDIDLKTASDTTTVQCKYLSKPSFINSAVREPISLMLGHFVADSSGQALQYVLYAHFENEIPGSEPKIDLSRLKEILTYTEKKVKRCYYEENGLTDKQLEDFLLVFKLQFGHEFSKQQTEILNLLKKHFGCSEVEADIHFYNNALRVIFDLAIKKNVKERTITRAKFLSSINNRKKLFNEWFILLRGKKEYLKTAAQTLKTAKGTYPSKSKMILIGKDIIDAAIPEMPLPTFIENMTEKYYKLASALNTATPLTFVLECSPEMLQATKEQLIDRGIAFNDGYEAIKFSSHIFNMPAVINTHKSGRITKSSYVVKVIGKDTLTAHFTTINHPKILINISNTGDIIDLYPPGIQSFDFKYCQDLKDAYQLFSN